MLGWTLNIFLMIRTWNDIARCEYIIRVDVVLDRIDHTDSVLADHLKWV